MKQTLLTLSLCIASTLATAQTVVEHSSYAFSSGVINTFSVSFENTDVKTVETWWKAQLKEISAEVSSKKEIQATGARIPQVSSDTIAILLKAVQPKKSKAIVLHVAFRVNNAYVNVDSDARKVEGCKSFVYAKAVAFKKEVAQTVLDAETKKLTVMQDQLNTLTKDNERARSSLEKSQEKAVEAGQEHVQVEGDLKSVDMQVASQQQAVASSPSESNTSRLSDLVKQQTKLKDRSAKLVRTEQDAKAKSTELQAAIERNLTDQATKTKEIEVQQAVVDELRKKLAEID